MVIFIQFAFVFHTNACLNTQYQSHLLQISLFCTDVTKSNISSAALESKI